MHPDARGITLQHADLRAVVVRTGAGLVDLRAGGRPLIAGHAAGDAPVGYQGVVLAPWPNRIGDGRYSFRSREYQLDLTEPDRGNALHGLVLDVPWTPVGNTGDSVRLTHRLRPSPGYPFALDLTVDYALTDAGLSFRLTAVNVGDTAAPYGGSFHPYLVAGSGRTGVDDWILRSPAARYLTVDPVRLLPGHLGTDPRLDFREPTKLTGIEVDHAFTDIHVDEDGRARLTLTDTDGVGAAMTWDRACPWLQLCIPGERFPRLARRAVAVEPMTCPPDAFRSGVDLIVLEPGDSQSIWMRIEPITTEGRGPR